jgi:aspartyl-tRNA(Asn)/glutamyl-tRNA(Gln) amidotransferase subunit A
MNDADLRSLIDEPARRHEATALELTDAILARIDQRMQMAAYISVTPEQAREAARAADQRRSCGRSLGPLDGIPIALKDNIDVVGVPATAGSAWFRGRVPRRDAVVVRRLKAAGAVIVGKTNMHELAYGATTANPHFGTCANAWDPNRVGGGSSGGSGVALGADLCLAALGTDTGGSVRIPAALNGVSALRPTYGSVSNRGVLAITPSLDTVGAMARSALDTAAVALAIAGYDRHDPYAVPPPAGERRPVLAGRRLQDLRVAIADGYFFDDVSEAVAANSHAAAGVLKELGATLERIDTAAARRATADCSLLIRAEALALHERRLARDGASLGEDVRRRLELGRDVSGVQVARALDRMRHWQARMRVALERVHMILTPTTPNVAPALVGAETISTTADLTSLTYPWSLAGLPAISLPSGRGEHGLPTGVQLTAAPWRDQLLLDVAVAFQQVTSFHRERPPAPEPNRG